MFPRKLSYSYQDETAAGVKSISKRVDVDSSEVYNLPKDTVYSYRTDVASTNDELRYMLSNERFNPLNQHDTGHEFWSQKYYVKNAGIYGKQNFSCRVPYAGGYNNLYYAGPILATKFLNLPVSSPLWSPYQKARSAVPAASDLIPLGTKAIAASSPTKSAASLAVALLELRDGLPTIPGLNLKRTKAVRNVHQSLGGEYLNVVFGWVPGIKDITQILSAMVNASKIINQYQRDSDSYVRRKMFFPEEKTTTLFQDSVAGYLQVTPRIQSGTSYVSPGMLSNDGSTGVMYGGNGMVSLAYQETTKKWFSGAFRYHLDSGDDLFSRINHTGQMAAKLLGARLDPASLWQAMPWSWLLDWFVDIGDIITNGTSASFNGQVLQYGYMMCTTTRSATITTDAPVAVKQLSGTVRSVGNLTATFVSQRKERIRATPFGFGLNPNSFTAQQWAILGALGMTRAPRSLW